MKKDSEKSVYEIAVNKTLPRMTEDYKIIGMYECKYQKLRERGGK